MKVICAGLGKTGTTTLAKALRILGHNVYDLQEHFDCHGQEWLDTFATDRLSDFKEMYEGVRDCSRIPSSESYTRIRHSEEVWLKRWKGRLRVILTKELFAMLALWWISCPGGEVFPKIWVGVCSARLETLTLFQTKIFDFLYPISDQTLTLFLLCKHLRRASNSQR